jgi:pyridoxal phosphate enzyme (YggS family)
VSVAQNLEAIRRRIQQAGRNPEEIAIVAVTKSFGAGVCRQALEAGLTVLGENRVQEALDKMGEVEGATWHLIGHLQTNKVRLAAGRFALIQSLDSVHLAEALARRHPGQHVLVEVNIAREPQKSGVSPEAATDLVRQSEGLVEVRGFMGMGPAQGDPTPAFRALYDLREAVQERLGKSLPILSMGMSGDYEMAAAAGSTMLRLGTALFGPRRV